MKKQGKTLKIDGKSDARKDRKSGTGMNGSPKKGGHGGKFTWAGGKLSLEEIGAGEDIFDTKDLAVEEVKEIKAM